VRLTGLAVHPLKSGAVRPLSAAAVVARRGLVDDRTWMAVDRDGVMVSCREARRLLHVVADTPATDPSVTADLRLRAPGQPDLLLEEPVEAPVAVQLFSLDLKAVPAGPEADAWLSAALGRDVRLVWCDDPSRRSLQPGYSRPGDHATFPDSFPVTVATEASLRQVNDWLAEAALERGEDADPLPMARFRPNLVVDGDEPFAEDGWSTITVGDVRFRVGKPVGRCFVTTIDPRTLGRGHEPVPTLARHRRTADGKSLFAVHLVPETSGTVRVGDPVSAS
jgi:uncharacterized protein YcbX